jgi:hypothetical protein
MYIDFHVEYLLFSSDFNDISVFRQVSEEFTNIKFHETPSIESRVVPRGHRRTGRHDEANSAFRSFANSPAMEVQGKDAIRVLFRRDS